MTQQLDSLLTPGAVVACRNRLWRVDGYADDVLTATTIDGGMTEQHRLYVPFEQVSQGHIDRPDPTRVGYPQMQDLLLRAHRLSLLHGSAPLLSLQRSRVIPENFQFVPVIMSLDTRLVRMLIADDVGLGKTIEGGLVITELLARQRARRLLVLCPANLRVQWREALSYFFHLDAKIISGRHRREMERNLPAGANPWERHPHLIASIDYAIGPAVKAQILEQPWDVVLIDEAHGVCKPHQTTAHDTVDKRRYELALELSDLERFPDRHLLLLTATPHSGHADSFASLIKMIHPDLVGGTELAPVIHRDRASRHVVQRRRKDVEEWFQRDGRESPLPKRDHEEVPILLTKDEDELLAAVENYGQNLLGRAEGRHGILARWTVMHLHRRALSSPYALRESMKNRARRLVEWSTGKAVTEDDLSIDEIVARANVTDQDTGERLTDEEVGKRMERQLFVSQKQDVLQAEIDEVKRLHEMAQAIIRKGKDSKLQRLLTDLLPERLKVLPKVIIFTRYLDTMTYLAEQIPKASKLRGVKVLTICGDDSEQVRWERFRELASADKAVLVATDAISEGINLQHAAAQVIHYELPWNPNRLEQRNGRVDRFGQPEKTVYVRTLVMDAPLDAAIAACLLRKSEEIRDKYGFCPPFFGDEETMLEVVRHQHMEDKLPSAGRQLLFDFEGRTRKPAELPDPFSDETLEAIKDQSFYGQSGVALPDVQERLEQTWRTVGHPKEVEAFVRSGLSRFRCVVTENRDHTLKLVVSEELRSADVPEVMDRVTFDPERARHDPDVTVLDLGHPLIRRLIDVIKHETFQPKDFYGRTAFAVVEAAPDLCAVLHVLVRFVVNTSPLNIVEVLLPVGVPLDGSKGVLDQALVETILAAPPTAERKDDETVVKAMEGLYKDCPVDQHTRAAAEDLRLRLVEERRAMKESLVQREGEEAASWLEGIDNLTLGSLDLLTVTVYFPAKGGA